MSAAASGARITLTRPGPETEASEVAELVEREAPALLAYFVRRVAAREDAADLLGDALVVVWRRRAEIPHEETRARMWLYGVARRVLSTHRRGARRREALSGALRLELLARPAANTEAVETARALLELLPEKDRELLRLSFWEGFSLAEIAEIMGMRPATVRSRHARALARLRSIVGDPLAS